VGLGDEVVQAAGELDYSLNSQFRVSSWTILAPYGQLGGHVSEKVPAFFAAIPFPGTLPQYINIKYVTITQILPYW